MVCCCDIAESSFADEVFPVSSTAKAGAAPTHAIAVIAQILARCRVIIAILYTRILLPAVKREKTRRVPVTQAIIRGCRNGDELPGGPRRPAITHAGEARPVPALHLRV